MPKQVRIAVIALGLLAMIGIVVYLVLPSGDALPTGQMLVNVMTGEQKRVSRDSIRSLPAPDDSGQRVWYPAYVEDGKVLIVNHYRGVLNEQMGERDGLRVDLGSYEVRR